MEWMISNLLHIELPWNWEQYKKSLIVSYCLITECLLIFSDVCACAVNVVAKNHLERAFFELGLATPQNTEVMTVQEVESLLSKLFHLAQRGRTQLVQPDYCTEITLSWLLKCLDRWIECILSTILSTWLFSSLVVGQL